MSPHQILFGYQWHDGIVTTVPDTSVLEVTATTVPLNVQARERIDRLVALQHNIREIINDDSASTPRRSRPGAIFRHTNRVTSSGYIDPI